jgi:hypothetical protein
VRVVLLSFTALAGVWMYVDWEIGSGSIASSSMFYVYGLVLVTIVGLFFGWGWVQRHATRALTFLDGYHGGAFLEPH